MLLMSALIGLYFSHHDWEIACDNTRTCRAAGYHADGDARKVSVLLTRPAGPNTAVQGELAIGSLEEDALPALPKVLKLTMKINGRSWGEVQVNAESMQAPLSEPQVKALLEALRGTGTIAWVAKEGTWTLSGKGASAVLLKMDEAQGRLGTPGALVRKGGSDEQKVLPPLPPVTFAKAPPVKPKPGDARFIQSHAAALLPLLKASTRADDCESLFSPETEDHDWSVQRLSETLLLVGARCWLAAYNAGNGYWVVQDKPPFRPVLVTTEGSEASDGVIVASHKGRGLGDCWRQSEWTWNGKAFAQTLEQTTGMCKAMAAGGVWTLPTLVAQPR